MAAHDGAKVLHAGDRGTSHDLEIQNRVTNVDGTDPYLRAAGLTSGKYEVKSLWRKDEGHTFDRRFKVGGRGERIYGRRDADIKVFARGLEEQIDSVLAAALTSGAAPGGVTRFVDETHAFVDQAYERRHGKAFHERLLRLAAASLAIPSLTLSALAITVGGVQGADIVRGYSDIEGIFIVAGPMYTLVTRTEIPEFLTFDSASAEGPKLRLVGVIKSETNNVRKEKGKNKK